MAHVRLGRAHQERAPGGTGRAERRTERGGLDRVADLRPGAVELHVLELSGIHTGPFDGQPHDRFLRCRARDRERVGGAVAVDRATADHTVDVIAVGQRLGERLEHDDATTLPAHIAVRAGVEGVGAAVR